ERAELLYSRSVLTFLGITLRDLTMVDATRKCGKQRSHWTTLLPTLSMSTVLCSLWRRDRYFLFSFSVEICSRYPAPITVFMYAGCLGSCSSFCLSRHMIFSTEVVPCKYSSP